MRDKRRILLGLGILAAVLIAAGALSAALGKGFSPFGLFAAQKPAVLQGTLPVIDPIADMSRAAEKAATEAPATKAPLTEAPATETAETTDPAETAAKETTTADRTTEAPSAEGTTEEPVTEEPVTDPPATEPPWTAPPETEPPETQPPWTAPPETEPPVTQPPWTAPPETEPPVTEPPATEPPATEPPATEPPATEPPATEPPATEPPATEPPSAEPEVPVVPDSLQAHLAASGYTADQLAGTQLLVVKGLEKPRCLVYAFEKVNGRWQEKPLGALTEIPGIMGRDGMALHTPENAKFTPIGYFGLGPAYGEAAWEDTALEYHQIQSEDYWVIDPDSKYYNQLFKTHYGDKDWKYAEEMIALLQYYALCIFVQKNVNPILYNEGSAIFVHIDRLDNSTSGCIGVERWVMEALFRWLRADASPHILLYPGE